MSKFIISCLGIHEYPCHPEFWFQYSSEKQTTQAQRTNFKYFFEKKNPFVNMDKTETYIYTIYSLFGGNILYIFTDCLVLLISSQIAGCDGYSWIWKQMMIQFAIIQDFKYFCFNDKTNKFQKKLRKYILLIPPLLVVLMNLKCLMF